MKKSPMLTHFQLKNIYIYFAMESSPGNPLKNSRFSHMFMCMDHYALDEAHVSLHQYFLCEYKFVYSVKVTFICT